MLHLFLLSFVLLFNTYLGYLVINVIVFQFIYSVCTLKIYNLLGQEVSALVSDKLTPVNYKYTWDASNFSSGVYLYKLEAGQSLESKKLLLLK